MKRAALWALLCVAPAFAQSDAPPTENEIAEAYRSKSGGGGTLFVRWERWRIREVRGWSVRFKRLSEDRSAGVLRLRYRAVAKKNGVCADYGVRDTIPMPPTNQQIQPMLVVEAGALGRCR